MLREGSAGGGGEEATRVVEHRGLLLDVHARTRTVTSARANPRVSILCAFESALRGRMCDGTNKCMFVRMGLRPLGHVRFTPSCLWVRTRSSRPSSFMSLPPAVAGGRAGAGVGAGGSGVALARAHCPSACAWGAGARAY